MRISPSILQKRIEEYLIEKAVDAYSASRTASCLVLSDLYGVASHGTAVFPSHIKRLRNGGYNATPHFSIVSSTPSVTIVDADNALGFSSASFCMETAIREAALKGMHTVWSIHSNAYGAAFCYPMLAADAGMIGITCCNSPAQMAPVGGKEKLLGTNPLSVVFPVPGDHPIIIDMATSKVAKSKFLQAKREGKPLGKDWALDVDGHPTTDPDEGIRGLVNPMEGFKGYGLALAIDILAGLLSGAAFLDGVNRFYSDSDGAMNVGQLFIAIDPKHLVGEDYPALVASYVQRIRTSTPVEPGMAVAVPGDDKHAAYAENLRLGIDVSDETASLLELC